MEEEDEDQPDLAAIESDPELKQAIEKICDLEEKVDMNRKEKQRLEMEKSK